MSSKHAVIIDSKGYKVDYVLVDLIELDGEIKETPQGYTLNYGESLVYTGYDIVQNMITPRWDGTIWEETATQEEIAAAQSEPIEPQLSEIDIILLAIDDLYKKMPGGVI